ncbi:MAG: alpha/beta hydrolase [Litorimonas sp.]
MSSDYNHITFSIPNMNFEGDAIISRQKHAKWRLICIPGAPSQTFLFKRLLQLTPNSLETVVVNRLGYGKPHDTPVLNFNEQVKIVEPFLSDKRTLLLGMSYGGAISLKAALNYPDDIEGVVTGAALISEPRNYAKAIVDFDKFDFLKPITPRRLQHMRAEIKGRRVQIGPLLEELKNLNIPIEVLHGTLDTLVAKEDAQTLVNAIGENAHYEEIVGGTHYLEMQMPQIILRAADRVIKRINSQSS